MLGGAEVSQAERHLEQPSGSGAFILQAEGRRRKGLSTEVTGRCWWDRERGGRKRVGSREGARFAPFAP